MWKVKLFPVNDKVAIGSIVQYKDIIYRIIDIVERDGDKFCDGSGILNLTSFTDIPVSWLKIMKYYIVDNKNIIGELHYDNYDDVLSNDIIRVKPQVQSILNRAEIGDEVEIFKIAITHLTYILSNKKITGIIIYIKGKKLRIDTFHNGLIEVHRHRVKLLNRSNFKNICKIIKND